MNSQLPLPERPDFVSSPFRYPGNQIYALEFLLSLIPDHDVYLEPFCGGASTFFAKPKAKTSWLNDIDQELVVTYRILRDNPEKLIALLNEQKISKERHNSLVASRPTTDIEIALRWFYLNRTSRLDVMSKFWEYNDHLETASSDWEELIRACSTKLQDVQLTSGDFQSVLDVFPKNAFLFVAPPYSIHHTQAQNDLHKYPFQREAHLRLAEVLRRIDRSVNFLVTYNEHPEIRQLYSWGEHLTIIKLPNKSPQKDEIAIVNYQI